MLTGLLSRGPRACQRGERNGADSMNGECPHAERNHGECVTLVLFSFICVYSIPFDVFVVALLAPMLFLRMFHTLLNQMFGLVHYWELSSIVVFL